MRVGIGRPVVLLGCLFLVATVGLSGVATAYSGGSPQRGDAADLTASATTPNGPPTGIEQLAAQLDEDEGDEGGEETDGGEENEGAALLGDWWGLGGEATETPYIGLVEVGVLLLGVGLGGYMLGKRTSLLPARYQRYLLPAHEWTMLVGTALTAPHFFAVEEWEGLGFAVGVLLGVEVVSGLYGRYLHRHVIRLGRGTETPAFVGRFIEISKETLLARWRRIHVSLTTVTGVVLVLHIVTAIG